MIVLKWQVMACFVPDGAGPMEVPTAQTLVVSNDFLANGGFVTVPGTNNNPTSGNISTACTTMATNAAAALNATANLTRIQNWGQGTIGG